MHIIEGHFVKASYEQVVKEVSQDGKRFVNGQVEIPNLVFERYSDELAPKVPHTDYLPLLSVTYGDNKHCDVRNLRLVFREIHHGRRRVSLVTRSEVINPRSGAVVVSKRPSQGLLERCRATVGNGVKLTDD
ncbi:hypothetical protein RF11_14044 [Thelohanellus kitauei]|uniref:Uncharacterized protein n=1 Tax=Thelohanellus kitauei TaxID=669202 RepID=A0A0C2JW75_THEKT|nr:hypothetical protein RF11_14044 [Thelohanellus kitauei]